MEIIIKSPNGTVYEAYQKDKDTYIVLIDGMEYKISLLEIDNDINSLSPEQRERITKELIENKELFRQLEKSKEESVDNYIKNLDDYKRFKSEVLNGKR